MSDFNGLVENVNRTPVEVMLRHILTDFPQRDFTDFLPMCQYAYNTAEHAALKASPYYASWGCHPRNPTMFRAKTSVCEFPAVEGFVSHQQTALVSQYSSDMIVPQVSDQLVD